MIKIISTLLFLVMFNLFSYGKETVFFSKQLNDTLRLEQTCNVGKGNAITWRTTLHNSKSKKKLLLDEVDTEIPKKKYEPEDRRGRHYQVFGAIIVDKTIITLEINYGVLSLVRYDFTGPKEFTMTELPLEYVMILSQSGTPRNLVANFFNVDDELFIHFRGAPDQLNNEFYHFYHLNISTNVITRVRSPKDPTNKNEYCDSVQATRMVPDPKNTFLRMDLDRNSEEVGNIVSTIVRQNYDCDFKSKIQYVGHLESPGSSLTLHKADRKSVV